MNLLDKLFLKLGYRPTHWSDDTNQRLGFMLEFVIKHPRIKSTTTEYEGYKVTLSVKKMKK